ncbi:MAG: Spy/CpxP family protein refolding chaperone [Gammaproteobacteria bacterium]
MNPTRVLAAIAVLLAGGFVYATAQGHHDNFGPHCIRDQVRGQIRVHGPFQDADMSGPFDPLGVPPAGAPPFLHDIELTDVQQDRIFDILHAQAPIVREQWKALHKAHEQIRELTASDKFDLKQVQSAADIVARALAGHMVLHAESESKIRALLTPEQRKQIAEFEPSEEPPLPPQ